MSAESRLVFEIGARLCMSAAAVEELSAREVAGWAEYFSAAAPAPASNDGDAVPLGALSRDTLRGMFGRRRP